MTIVAERRKEHPEIATIEFSYSDFEDLDDEYKDYLLEREDDEFVVLIEPMGLGLNFYHVLPGRCCMTEDVLDVKVENATQIADFVHSFYKGHFMPILPVENITETMENNSTLKSVYELYKTNWTFINSA